MLGDDRHELVQERLAEAHLVAVEHRAAEQPADDVLLLVRSGQHVLVNGERAGPDVVGDPPQPAAVVARPGSYFTPQTSPAASTSGRRMSMW